jgi:hypothetical protein
VSEDVGRLARHVPPAGPLPWEPRPSALAWSPRLLWWPKLIMVLTVPWTRMPPAKLWSSADLAAAIERVTPEVLVLLSDGVPRAEAAIIAALADRHPKDDVRRTLMRLAVLEQLVLVEKSGKHTLPEAG